ncbi:Wadjet anti-phage system protein JetD domain-containing protein [Agromyces neolithicus]|uniref:DUF2220 family protein n=1 Tax=Agromyces neolithicus TaxID=269420 RepID=A0ABN2M8T1_9MICO
MAASMVSVAEARSRAARIVERAQRDWAAALARGETPDASFELVLRPPTEREALARLSAAVAWVGEWRAAEARGGSDEPAGLRVTWAERRWPSVGAQVVPERLVVQGPDAIAAFGGVTQRRDWRRLADRAAAVHARFVGVGVGVGGGAGMGVGARAGMGVGMGDGVGVGDGLGRSAALGAAVRSEWRALIDYRDHEFATLLDVVEWLVAHPSSGWRVRQLPIRGIDTKWLERHRRTVESFYGAVTGGTSLGLAESQSTVRVRFLDEAVRPGGIEDLAAPVAELARLPIAPQVVFVFENLETVLAMPPMPSAVVVHGSGYAVTRLGEVPWVREANVIYWGDLDSDGFRVLHTIRTVVPNVTSVLMDEATLDRFGDLAVVETRPATGSVDLLTDTERHVFDRLRAGGGVRLEQERVPWAYAHDELIRAAEVVLAVA